MVGNTLPVYDLKQAPTELAAIMGQAVEIKAMQLPFLVGKVIADPNKGSATLDVRFLRLMRVSKEFAAAQAGGPTAATQRNRHQSRSCTPHPLLPRNNL